MHKLVSCAELIKREYIKAVSTPRRREKLPASLWQYNHLFNAASTVRGEQAVEQDGDATQAHHEVIQQLVVDVDGKNGRKRPKKEHQPRLTIILSTKKLPHTDGKRVHFQTRPTASKLTGGHHSFQPPSDKKKTRRRHKASDKNISSEQRGEDHGDLSQGRRGGEVPKASGASSSTQEYSQQAQPRKAAYSQSQTQSSATQEEDTGEPMQTD